MEQMVTDQSVRKVVVVCDQLYAEKADGREGGVGTETQIISREVYEQVDAAGQEQKFVAVIAEKDEEGNPYVPTFLKSRIYIDMSDPELRDEKFEQLVRWIYDKPIHKRPERGKPPAYLFAEDKMELGTGSRARRAMEAVRQDKASALGAIRDYFDTFAENLEAFRIEPGENKPFDEQVVESIEAFLPYRDELVDLFVAIVRHRSDPEAYEAIHTFFERLLPYKFWPAERPSWNRSDADNFRFILYELFLYVTAALVKHKQFEKIDRLVEKDYYLPPGSPEAYQGGLVPFTLFQGYIRSLGEHRKKRLESRHVSITAELIKERANRSDLMLDDVMQYDLVLMLRSELRPGGDEGYSAYYYDGPWFPRSLVYATMREHPFEIFTRAQSATYFDQVKVALGVKNKEQLLKLIEEFDSEERYTPKWGPLHRIYPATLMNIERIATRP
jgi:hypothetical protein